MEQLTVIIPFLNENEEVFNTVKNLRESTTEKFDILLINDASDDGYDYEQVAKDFNCNYILHSERQGVAGSREDGIASITTEYFLLLDAHMRVYQNDWVSKIISAINKNKRAVFCCLTKSLKKGAVPYDKDRLAVGAYLNLHQLTVEWTNSDLYPEYVFNEIPCILGASYACNKTYWQYLRGIKGLLAYGFDEQLISMKVWMEGGKCLLINDVVFGHIFRLGMKVPYTVHSHDYFFNKLLICELLVDNLSYKQEYLKHVKREAGIEEFNKIIKTFVENTQKLLEEQAYYKSIFHNDFDFVIKMNEEFVNRHK